MSNESVKSHNAAYVKVKFGKTTHLGIPRMMQNFTLQCVVGQQRDSQRQSYL